MSDVPVIPLVDVAVLDRGPADWMQAAAPRPGDPAMKGAGAAITLGLRQNIAQFMLLAVVGALIAASGLVVAARMRGTDHPRPGLPVGPSRREPKPAGLGVAGHIDPINRSNQE